MLKLHHLNNSRSQRILWLLEEVGAEYELVAHRRNPETNLAPPELLAVHPLGKSPVIETEDGVIAESAAIVEWICARHAPSMIPAPGTPAALEHLQLMHFAEGSAMTPILLNLYTSRLGEAAAPLRPRIEQQLASHFDYMEAILRPSGHFVLDEMSAVDVMMTFPAEIAIAQGRGKELSKLGAFVAWVHARPAWTRAKERGGAYAFG